MTKDGQSIEVPLNLSLIEDCSEIGVEFACQVGACGTCEVKVTEGADLLSPPTEQEEDHELAEGHRLCCQMQVITEGDITLEEA